jgi:hypothetical protein
MPVLLTIMLLVLALPLLFIVGIAAGPAALVILFIAGWALLVLGILRVAHGSRRGRVGPPSS